MAAYNLAETDKFSKAAGFIVVQQFRKIIAVGILSCFNLVWAIEKHLPSLEGEAEWQKLL